MPLFASLRRVLPSKQAHGQSGPPFFIYVDLHIFTGIIMLSIAIMSLPIGPVFIDSDVSWLMVLFGFSVFVIAIVFLSDRSIALTLRRENEGADLVLEQWSASGVKRRVRKLGELKDVRLPPRRWGFLARPPELWFGGDEVWAISPRTSGDNRWWSFWPRAALARRVASWAGVPLVRGKPALAQPAEGPVGAAPQGVVEGPGVCVVHLRRLLFSWLLIGALLFLVAVSAVVYLFSAGLPPPLKLLWLGGLIGAWLWHHAALRRTGSAICFRTDEAKNQAVLEYRNAAGQQCREAAFDALEAVILPRRIGAIVGKPPRLRFKDGEEWVLSPNSFGSTGWTLRRPAEVARKVATLTGAPIVPYYE